MLSPRGVPPPQQEGSRLVGDAEEEELEEGEVRLDGDDDLLDPDVAFSYIDEKLQHVLGHFQKDFEGGVSADSLGPKFGGYGSFLPTYENSPLLPQTRSSHVASNMIASSLPYKPSAERMDQILSTVVVESISRNNNSIAPSSSDSLDSSFNGTDSKSFNVQMKVGSDNLLPRKNAAIYCGMGLNISSSESMEESPDGLGGLSPEFSNLPCESPQTILQVMTCFQVPGGFMLSPLHDKILQLTNKFSPLLKKWEEHLSMENLPSNEDKTTHATNALYVIPAPAVGVSRTAEDIATLSAQNGQLEQSRKRKTAPSDGNGPIESSYHTPLETPSGFSHLPSVDKKGFALEGSSQYTSLNVTAHGNKTSAHHQGYGSGKKLGVSFGGEEKSKPRIPNQDIQKPPAQDVHIPIKERKQEVCSTSVKFDASQMETLSRRSNVKNGVQHATVRQGSSKPSGVSPIGKDSSMVAFALKEAQDLKHKANHLKNEGLKLESTGLYFEAALKFLHVAFLLETPNFDSSRPDAAAQSMKMYSETAKLCKFCAHEYERSKKMASAALAYKCVEVAYLKAAYYKNLSTGKDRQELQAVVQLAPGELQSSFPSDIDYINSHGLSKNSSTKDGIMVGNRLPLAVRNQVHLLRLLAYINDVNHAFAATRKSQIAIVSATENQEEKCVNDGLASVKTVLDCNFSNVNELLRLIRLSMESISI